RQQNRAGLEHAEVGLQQPVTIAAEKSHTVPGLDSQRAQASGEPCSAVRKLSVGDAMLAADHRGFARVLLVGVTQETNWSERNIHREPPATRRTDLHPPPAHDR